MSHIGCKVAAIEAILFDEVLSLTCHFLFRLSQNTMCYTPKVEEVLAVLPMIEACRAAKPSTAGVIKISELDRISKRQFSKC